MRDNAPTVVKTARRVMLTIEHCVRQFPRFHKYHVGARLREQSLIVTQCTVRAWRNREHRAAWVAELVGRVDDLKETLQFAQDLRAFRSFAQFEALAREISDLGRQCGGWQKQQHSQGQKGRPPESAVPRAEILSARGASIGANL